VNYIIEKVGSSKKVIPMIMPFHPLVKNVRPENYHKTNIPAATEGFLLGITVHDVKTRPSKI